MTVLFGTSDPRQQERLLDLVNRDPNFHLVGATGDGSQILRLAKELRPNVVLLTSELERMSAIEVIEEIMIDSPTPVLLVVDKNGGEVLESSLEALKAGALAILRLPNDGRTARRERDELEFLATIKAMAEVRLVRRWRRQSESTSVRCVPRIANSSKPSEIVAIGASTGGPAALKTILDQLPENFPVPTLVVQHISPGFIAGVASWLNDTTPLNVVVAEHGQLLRPGTVYIAPDDFHLGLSSRKRIVLSDDGPVDGFRPAATYTFRSVAKCFDERACAVILTGMGRDGLPGLEDVRGRGGRIIAQSQASAVVFGMPGAAVNAGLADAVLPAEEIGEALLNAVQSR